MVSARYFCYLEIVHGLVATYKLVSQSCAVAKSENFWRATGQSNLANRMEDCSTGQSAVVVSENENKEQKRLLGLGSYGVAWLTRRTSH